MKSPIIQWAGGKKKLLDTILKNAPQSYRNYYEPFIGGGIVCLNINFEHSCKISDSNTTLTILYNIVKEEPEKLLTNLKEFKECLKEEYSKEEFKEMYIKYRAEFNELKLKKHKSEGEVMLMCVIFLFINKNCYCAVYRENSKGVFNVPSGTYTYNFFSEGTIREASKVAQNIEIQNGDFEECCCDTSENDFVFLDPPYAPRTKGALTKYTKNDFTWDDQKRVKSLCDRINDKAGYFMLCNSDTEEIRELYKDYHINYFTTNACLNSDKTKRKGTYKEVIVTNYEPF
jgi:DNA adenine methylase